MSAQPSDADLVRLARRGDVPAMGLLLERHRPALFAHALRLLGHRRADDLEDIVQDTFLQALNRLAQLEEPERFAGWVHTILRNACYQYLRRRRWPPVVSLSESWDAADLEPLNEPGAPFAGVAEQVWAAIEALPKDLQAAVLLRHFGARRSYDAIADCLGVPVGTVRSRLHTARRRLAASLRAAADRDGGDLLQRLEAEAELFEALLVECYRDGRRDLFAQFADNMVLHFPNEAPRHGRIHLENDFTGDHEAGVRLEVDEVTLSTAVAVLDGRLISPPHDPYHCPPAATMLAFRDAGRVTAVQMYFGRAAAHPAS